MTVTDHRIPGTVAWVDLATTDADAASFFYGQLFGWVMEHTTTPAGGYHLGWVAGSPTAGIMDQPPELRAAGVPPAWTVYFRVADLESLLETIEDMGGKIDVPPFEAPGATRIAIASDPTGAVFGLFEGGAHRGLNIRTVPGALCWAEVLTRDVPTTAEFYERVFGWQPDTAPTGSTDYTTFKLDKLHVAGMLPMPAMVPREAPSHWLLYFHVASCHATVDDAIWLGAEVAVSPTTVGPGTFAILHDPQGATFSVFETKFPQ